MTNLSFEAGATIWAGRFSSSRPHPDLRPGDERTALVQRLDHYRTITSAALVDVPWEQASARLLADTDMTIAGIINLQAVGLAVLTRPS